ncbi:MAG: hypothetical protein LQ351_006092 [Letrouitia transgressa]|nr:MAG: hypothetical protein LQ351_006092 [Letrouitia transgressa]
MARLSLLASFVSLSLSSLAIPTPDSGSLLQYHVRCTGEARTQGTTQTQALLDGQHLIQAIYSEPSMHFYEDIHTPLTWLPVYRYPPPHHGCIRRWVGARGLWDLKIHPIRISDRNNEDVFSMETVLEAAKLLRTQCTGGYPMRHGNGVVGPKMKWVVEIIYPSAQYVDGDDVLNATILDFTHETTSK